MGNKDCTDSSDNGCKIFHHEPYYTPNNYDLYFDYNSIPVNIQAEKAHDLKNRLQKLMPLGKIVHLNMNNDTIEEHNNIHLHTNLRLNYKTAESIREGQLKIKGVWNRIDESSTGKINYELYYLDETPMNNVEIILINTHYPLIQYTNTTNLSGRCVIEDLPYGTYVQQLVLNEYLIPPSIIEVNENEITSTLFIGSWEEYYNENDENPDVLNFYNNATLMSSSVTYEEGELDSDNPDDKYINAKLTLMSGSGDETGDDSPTILFDSPTFEAITDFTEFKVEILGLNNEVVDIVHLNFRNNYTKTSKTLPLYDGDKLINYQLRYSQENCEVNYSYLELTKFTRNEVVLL